MNPPIMVSGKVNIQLDVAKLPPATPINYVNFSRFAGDVVLNVGLINIPDLVTSLDQGGGDVTVSVAPSHQFFMSLTGFAHMYSRMNEFAESLRAKGVKLPPAGPTIDTEGVDD